MKTIYSALFAGILTLGLLGASSAAQADDVEGLRSAPIPETNQAPEVYDPVVGMRLLRSYRQQPPMIPHEIDKYQVDLKTNECLKCHDWPQYVTQNAPMISQTHYVDRDGKPTDGVARSRWFCNQCHVPQFDARPLVENTFDSGLGR